jgi:hypothetical protein
MMKKLPVRRRKLCSYVLVALFLVMICSTSLRAEGEQDESTANAPAEVSSPVKAEGEPDRPTASVYADVLSQYIWRGMAYSKDSAVIEPSMTASYKGFSLNVWGNFDTNAKPPGSPAPYKGATWTETDLTFSYTHTIYGDLSGSVGGIYYAYDSAPDSFEVYGGLSYAFPWLTVGVTSYREVSHYPGWWVEFDFSRNFKLPWYDMSTDLGMSFFYLNSSDNDAYPDPSNPEKAFTGMLSGQLAASLNIPIGKYITVSPRIGYAFPLSHQANQEITFISWDHQANHVFGGLRIAAAF